MDFTEPGKLETFIPELMANNTGVRWAVDNGRFTFQAKTFLELIEKTQPFTLEGIASQIQCPMLVCEAEADHFFAGQPAKLYEALTCPKTFMLFTAEDGREEHCQFGALILFNQRVYEWLDDVMEGLGSR
ncbi:hypothetical protein P4H70_16275 [Paenibacillus ehimensis]|uniref:hypothetical protein n=1 Tax=Paenibacillus ehimensis TaxID=79264 RepID=UPI002DC03412|nr:hypothetical protein [Paenibacillus ehimensis]MEC0210497.1 hypothetical protein [Paenibacillus ehimensis]